MKPIQLGDRSIGPGEKVFVIAEAGVNHNGDPATALQLIDIAAAAGADAIKFQTFRAESLVTAEAPKAEYQIETTGSGESQFAMLQRLELSQADHRAIQEHCRRQEIEFLSTPFDEAAADFLDELGVPAFKISSGDLTNLPLLEHVASKGKPILLSTGMAAWAEVVEAVVAIRGAGCDDLMLFQCVSNYPANPADVNLRAMQTMRDSFDLPVGYSDHTEGIEVSLAAVALGASVIEKHFTLDKNLPGPDHRASLEPDELKAMIQGIRKVEAALGHGRKIPAASERDVARVARRSLVAACDIAAGTSLNRAMISLRRPGTGLPPAQMPTLLGHRARVDITAGSMFTLDMLD